MKIEKEEACKGSEFGKLEFGTVFKAEGSSLTWIKTNLESKNENCVALENGQTGYVPLNQVVTFFPDAVVQLGKAF